MKRYFFASIFLVACAHGVPPAAPAKPLANEDPAPIVDGDVTVGWLHGMQILVKKVPGAEFVAARLVIRGGVRNWDKDSAGVEQLALAVASHGGTATLDRDAFARKLASLGAAIGGGAEEDYSVLASKAPLDAWNETLDMMVDAFLHPALPPTEIEVQRQSQLVRLRREQEIPDARLRLMGHMAMFKGHPYEHRAIGTIDNVTRFDAAALGAHLAKLRETGRLLLVVVGDVDGKAVIERAAKAFGALPRGDYHESPFGAPAFDASRVIGEQKKLPTNYIQSLFPGPTRKDPDFVPGMVAMNILGEREWDEVRTKRNLSYAPGAGLRTASSLPIGFLYVTAVDPMVTMKVMLDETKRLREQPVPPKELAGGKSVFLTNFLMGSESTDGQAELLARMQVLAGDWKRARTLPDEVRAVSAEQVQAFARKWMGKWQTVLLGDPAKLDQALFN